MHSTVKAQFLISLEKPSKTWIAAEIGDQSCSAITLLKTEVGYFLADKVKSSSATFSPFIDREKKFCRR